jgi:hypothetical protein
VRRLIGIVVVGQLLARTEAAAVKGASNVEIRVGTRRARVSSDLDAVCRHSLDAFRDQLAEALRDGWDAFTGLLVDDGEIPAPVPEGVVPIAFGPSFSSEVGTSARSSSRWLRPRSAQIAK